MKTLTFVISFLALLTAGHAQIAPQGNGATGVIASVQTPNSSDVHQDFTEPSFSASANASYFDISGSASVTLSRNFTGTTSYPKTSFIRRMEHVR